MQTDLIIVREFCQKSQIDPSFIILLEQDGLIELQIVEGERYLLASQLHDLERFIRWHNDLSVNVGGIGVIHDLLGRMHDMQHEINQLRREIHLFRDENRIDAQEY